MFINYVILLSSGEAFRGTLVVVFEFDILPQDIASSRYGNLALDLMFRYCQDEDSIEDFAHFVSKGGIQVPGSGCPFAASSIKLVELICQVRPIMPILHTDMTL